MLCRRTGNGKNSWARSELAQCLQPVRMRNLLVEQFKQHVALQRNFQFNSRYRLWFHLQNLERRSARGRGLLGFKGHCDWNSHPACRTNSGGRLLRFGMANLDGIITFQAA